MKVLIWRALALLALVSVAGLIAIGCGSDDETTTTATETETEAAAGGGAAGGGTTEIKMGDYYFDPQNATLKAGPTTIEAPNEGSVEHELVLFESNENAADLPTEASGDVDEEKLEEEGGEEAGEIEDVEAGDTKSGKFNLKPGKYVMFCNLPGHYARGMYGTVVVK